MKNFVQAGQTLAFIAPAGGITSGGVIVAGSLVGVAATDAAAGAEVACDVVGVFTLPKATGALAFGAKVYWDNTAKNVTATATGNTLLGAVVAAAASGATTALVRLNGTAV